MVGVEWFTRYDYSFMYSCDTFTNYKNPYTILSRYIKQGVLDNGEEIAVKKLYCAQQPGLDNDKQFQNECTNLMRAQHKNIVRLIGYCYEIRHEIIEHNGGHVLAGVEEKILCFEYLQSGSLENHLSGMTVLYFVYVREIVPKLQFCVLLMNFTCFCK